MPTYDYKCDQCGKTAAVIQSMSAYREKPIVPQCHGSMYRILSVVPAMSGLANALAGDRHYEGLRAPDGTDIGSRTKHREYMKRHGLTTADDFKSDWKKAAKEREAIRKGTFTDKSLRQDLERQVIRG